MKKMFKIVLMLNLFLLGFVLSSCNIMGNLTNNQKPGVTTGNFDIAESLQDVYQLAVAQGYEGTYEEWISE